MEPILPLLDALGWNSLYLLEKEVKHLMADPIAPTYEQPDMQPVSSRSFADWLAYLCVSSGELATRLGISQSSVSRWEHGWRIPRRATQRRIAEALEVPPHTIRWQDDHALRTPPGWQRGRPRRPRHPAPTKS
jgi:DNA-binding XRE family transcriptional regulator